MHTKENCFKLHGKDKVLSCTGGFKGFQLNLANQTTLDSTSDTLKTEDNVPTLSKAKLEHLRALIDSLNKPSTNCALAMIGKNLSSLSFNVSSTVSKDQWIINSGATD